MLLKGKTHQLGTLAGIGFAEQAADVFFNGAGT
jgi:hypothetical protein